MEQVSKHAESSHQTTEYHSDGDGTKLEVPSTASDDDVFTSIQYPSLPPAKNFPLHFPKPYLHNQDFKGSDQALRYTMRYFNHQTIHQSLKSFIAISSTLTLMWKHIISTPYNTILTNQYKIKMQNS